LLFILVVALMFFGPRKLPQLSRQIGKSLAEFRKASEDFKRTWEREVELESSRTQLSTDNSLLDGTSIREQPMPDPLVGTVPAENVIARQKVAMEPALSTEQENSENEDYDTGTAVPSRKQDWL
jgi:TatA/E family protein of Tat protein translocase